MQQPPNQEYLQTYVLDKIPFEEQRVIDELVGLWQTYSEPSDLLAHIRGTLKQGCTSVTFFFAQVRDDLRTDKHRKYTASSAFEFRQFLETEYRRLYQPYAERQAKAQAKAEVERQAKIKAEAERQAQIRAEIERKAQIKAENERRTRAVFDALCELMTKTTDRKERIELGRKRKALAPYTGVLYVDDRHCKNCFKSISSAINPRCLDCKGYICLNCECCFCEPDKQYKNVCWKCRIEISKEICEFCSICGNYICSNCDSCFCNRVYIPIQDTTVDTFLPDYPDDLS